jgi:ATP-dependent exoDNAse (exonuclease V) alpha subunit
MLLTDKPETKLWVKETEALGKTIEKGRSLFITGPAGTGKSQLVKELKERLGPTAVLTSTTGISAMNIGGSTIHSFAGIGIHCDPRAVESIAHRMNWPQVRDRIVSANTIIIDEISMLRSDTLTLIDRVFRRATRIDKTFGGKPIVFVGDFLQLPPVPQHDDADENIWSFNSDCWGRAEPSTLLLEKIHRQTESGFLEALSEIRLGHCTEKTDVLFRSREVLKKAADSKGKLHFFPTNREAESYNQDRLADLPGASNKYGATIWGMTEALEAQIRNTCLGVPILELKVDARVIILINDKDKEFVNGSLGTIVQFDDMRNPVVKIDRTGKVLTFERHRWELKNYKDEMLASFDQIPLKLAYGITIHKSQGLTLDEAVIDCQKIFAPGQAYVALSRVKDSAGLYLRNWDSKLVKADQHALQFYKKLAERRVKP